MSRTRRNETKATYERSRSTGRNRDAYVYGSAAPKLDLTENRQAARRVQNERNRQEQNERNRHEVMKSREKAHHMSAGYVLFLFTALCAAGIILVNYIQLQAELTNLSKAVNVAEAELNSMKEANDEEYGRILHSINLEEIRRIAVEELGMIYAQEGQIITYENEGNDYMRQVSQDK